ncbi:sentrin-specific protease 7b isoform X1 [Alosa alosa]|uniref:sentrin-specific protease 7b isoform X1 n=1 Tax=Alosa alosa TaxID=278164 RepID=UPI0020153E3B|nr:sentrin-specific protease 7b isoform X1 [Alosa alosa]
METPFRIPKIRQPSDSNIHSQSPLRYLNDDTPCKSSWTSTRHASKWNQDSQTLTSGNTQKPKSQMNGGADRWRPKRASDSLCHEDSQRFVGDSPRPQRFQGNGGVGKRKSPNSEEEEEFSWTKTPVKQRPKSPDRDTPLREDGSRGLNGGQAAENGSWHKKNGEGQGKPPTPTTHGNSPPCPPKRSAEASVVADTPEKTPLERPQPSSVKGGSSSSSSPSGYQAKWRDQVKCPTPEKTPLERPQPSSVKGGGSSSSSPSGYQAKWRDQVKCPSRPPLRVPPKNPYDEDMKRLMRPRCLRTYSRKPKPKPGPIEPIVLSSDDEKGDEDDNDMSLRRSSQNQTEPSAAGKSSAGLQEVPSVMELPFAELHMGSLRAQSRGAIMITHEGLGIPLKGGSGDEVSVTAVASELRRYGVWDGGLAQDGSLFPASGEAAPSLLFLVVSDPQARLMQSELMEIQSIHRPGQASPFMLLVLNEHLEDLQAALLASIMDLVGLRSGQPGLSSPLAWAEGLELLHCSGQEEHLLALLGQPPGSPGRTEAQGGARNGEQSPSGRGASQSSQAAAKASSSVSSTWKTRSAGSPCRTQALPRRLIQYPPPPSKGGITVTTEDLECLKSGEFLNDVIIDFYLKYLLQERADQDMRERSHIFSSFFYKQLTRKDTASEEATEGSSEYRRHQRVRTWTRHVDIFNKDYIFVPVNQEAHWYLVIICFPGLEKPQVVKWGGPVQEGSAGVKKKCEPQASSQGTNVRATSSYQRSQSLPDCTQQSCTKESICRRPCILVMDSLKLSFHERIYKLLRDYLQVEWEVRRGTPRRFTPDNMKGSHCKVPLQDNSSDCGLYLLQYVEAFLQNPVVHFDPPLRLEHWFPRQQVRRKREEIRDLVLQLYHQQGAAK